MNTALPEMLNCLRTATGAAIKGGEMSVLERQKLVLKWQQDQLLQPIQQQQQQQQQSSLNELSVLGLHDHSFMGLINGACVSGLNQVLNRPVKPDQGLEPGWSDGVTMDSYSGYSGLNYAISRTTSCPPAEVAAQEAGPPPAIARNGGCGRASFKKRKGEQSMNTEVEAEEERRAKKMKGSGEEEESKITEQNSNTNQTKKSTTCNKDHKNNNKEASSGCTSKDNYSKASEVQKPDYIHVRARRGQATDSHSLAERVRREKISERMKYLQELVPGCNKITGKAGMLDEIINYVQSLQRQVEFLSMKLATVNPRLDFSIDELLAKEVIEGCSASLPANPVGLSPEEIANPPYMHYNPLQQMGPLCGSEFGANPIDMGLRRAISASVSMPEGFFDASCFNQIPSSLPWDADLQNIFMMEFQQGRPSSFHSHTFTGPNDASSLKMEM